MAMAATSAALAPVFLSISRIAAASAFIWSPWDCVAWFGSSRLRCSGYCADAVAMDPLRLSTRVTRTLSVPKSTPATVVMQRAPCQMLSDFVQQSTTLIHRIQPLAKFGFPSLRMPDCRLLSRARKHVANGRVELLRGHVFDDSGIADANGKDEPPHPADVFLVAGCSGDDLRRAQLVRRKRSVGINEILKPRPLRTAYRSATARYFECRNHAPADGFAMQHGAIARDTLDGVAYGVAEIQDHAQSGFALVLPNHFRFHADRRSDYTLQRSWVAGQHFGGVPLHEAHEQPVADDAGFHAFHQPRAQLAIRQRSQDGDVRKDGAGLMKAAHHIFAFRQIHAGFAADT